MSVQATHLTSTMESLSTAWCLNNGKEDQLHNQENV